MIEVAPYEVASDVTALPKGKYLYHKGKKYLRPTLDNAEFLRISNGIIKSLHTPSLKEVIINLFRKKKS